VPESPILLIEKEKFLPLFLRYRVPANSGERIVTVRFENYKKLEPGWFPYKIIYSAGNDTEEEYFVEDLKINLPIESPLSVISVRKTPSTDDNFRRPDAMKEKRLQEVIDTLKKKYH
jgi:hypothetical protein